VGHGGSPARAPSSPPPWARTSSSPPPCARTPAAAHARKLGILQYEYELAAGNPEPWYKQRNTRRFSRSAIGLSADYQALADEILGRFVARNQQAAPA
jgi:hypothetical protein